MNCRHYAWGHEASTDLSPKFLMLAVNGKSGVRLAFMPWDLMARLAIVSALSVLNCCDCQVPQSSKGAAR